MICLPSLHYFHASISSLLLLPCFVDVSRLFLQYISKLSLINFYWGDILFWNIQLWLYKKAMIFFYILRNVKGKFSSSYSFSWVQICSGTSIPTSIQWSSRKSDIFAFCLSNSKIHVWGRKELITKLRDTYTLPILCQSLGPSLYRGSTVVKVHRDWNLETISQSPCMQATLSLSGR